MLNVTIEIVSNWHRIHRMALNELNVKNKGNFLGIVWLWINPMFQVFIYTVIFGTGMRNNAPVENVPYVYWLISGIIVWFFISSVVTQASRSIISKIQIVTKMRYPVSITPIVVVFSEFYNHLLILMTVVIAYQFLGFPITKAYLQFPYFLFASIVFLSSVSLFNSSLTVIVRDYQHIVYNIMRMLFYITPVLWVPNTEIYWLNILVKINPLSYLVSGYRDILVYSRYDTLLDVNQGIYFWGVAIIFYFVGSILHVKMRKNLLDYA